MTLAQMLLAAAAVTVIWLYFDGMRVREAALRAGRDYCEAAGLQLLDETVARQSIGMARDADGQLRIRRSFGFEFTSDGERRYRGKIVMLGVRVETVWVQLHRILH
ncbi:MAG: DUF3301 domain-containing protein [Pseudomonadales bacterium]|jgi:hypothetical protein|nr:DUF3301 domain-containing protein [Pseudomonadales bacterium]MCP5320961.1 DUF3301 domain-containing protein [Pseudomonadales bacterium]